jgi:hypothetical protein
MDIATSAAIMEDMEMEKLFLDGIKQSECLIRNYLLRTMTRNVDSSTRLQSQNQFLVN